MFLRILRPLLVIGFLTGGGGGLLLWGWKEVRTQQTLDHGAAVVDGRVIDHATRKLSKGGQSWSLVVEYVPEGGEAITAAFDVDGATYRSALESGNASVTYSPQDPEVARVTRFAILPFQMVAGLGGVMLFAGACCIPFAMRTASRKGG